MLWVFLSRVQPTKHRAGRKFDLAREDFDRDKCGEKRDKVINNMGEGQITVMDLEICSGYKEKIRKAVVKGKKW
jgi:hypothetical protein